MVIQVAIQRFVVAAYRGIGLGDAVCGYLCQTQRHLGRRLVNPPRYV
jgi:hypothetical protein